MLSGILAFEKVRAGASPTDGGFVFRHKEVLRQVAISSSHVPANARVIISRETKCFHCVLIHFANEKAVAYCGDMKRLTAIIYPGRSERWQLESASRFNQG